ncbi:integral peroxisomal membrane peroxin-domain-containing protein [Amylostereum chailletii]|nr:integral peroxisomal membrane peroxin-domain-containing protein [Amylostereum chailletii]
MSSNPKMSPHSQRRSFSLSLSPTLPAAPLLDQQHPPSASTIAGVPTLFEFVHTVPAPLTTVLVTLAPEISLVRRATQVISWKTTWDESWLVVAAWWGACLALDYGIRYFLPAFFLLGVVLARRRRSPLPTLTPLTENALQIAISDLTIIQSLLPSPPPLPSSPFPHLLRASATLYVPYIVLTYFVPLRILVGIAGTLVLVHRAPWAAIVRRSLWRSAWVRWGAYRAWSLLSGTPLPVSIPPASIQTADVSQSTQKIRFLFTVLENQRWWMGLDFTAALLPNERPSWCTTALAPIPPPSAFPLPEPSVAFLDDGKGGRVKRVAIWNWEEPEWKVTVRKEGDSGSGREVRAVPAPKEEGSASRLKKLMDVGVGEKTKADEGAGSGRAEAEDGETLPDHDFEDEYTDSDGWVFGDNKWESRAPKGGMGKYTRYRRWTRIALLSEVVEPVEPGATGVLREEIEPPTFAVAKESPRVEKEEAPKSAPPARTSSPDEHRTSKLRARLQAAMGGSH